MFSIFTHVMKPVRDTNSEPGLPPTAVVDEREPRGRNRAQFSLSFSLQVQQRLLLFILANLRMDEMKGLLKFKKLSNITEGF